MFITIPTARITEILAILNQWGTDHSAEILDGANWFDAAAALTEYSAEYTETLADDRAVFALTDGLIIQWFHDGWQVTGVIEGSAQDTP